MSVFTKQCLVFCALVIFSVELCTTEEFPFFFLLLKVFQWPKVFSYLTHRFIVASADTHCVVEPSITTHAKQALQSLRSTMWPQRSSVHGICREKFVRRGAGSIPHSLEIIAVLNSPQAFKYTLTCQQNKVFMNIIVAVTEKLVII